MNIFQCLDDEFSCSDGTCLPFQQRCDGVSDCNDSGDEMNCELV